MILKKSLGQHFLHNPYYLGFIANSADIKKDDTVLEIGPGEGTLTEVLLTHGANVIAIEKDRRLIPLLQKRFAGQAVEIIEADALDFEIAKLKIKNFKVVGNIPYYITGALLKKFLSAKKQPDCLVFLVQKEVAERICAKSKVKSQKSKESVLSLSIKAYGTPKHIKMLPRGAFTPAPRVDSAILLVEHISRKNFKNAAHEKRFFELVRAGFAQKRKLLTNNLKTLLGPQHSDILKKVGISEKARAEGVPLEQWLELAKY